MNAYLQSMNHSIQSISSKIFEMMTLVCDVTSPLVLKAKFFLSEKISIAYNNFNLVKMSLQKVNDKLDANEILVKDNKCTWSRSLTFLLQNFLFFGWLLSTKFLFCSTDPVSILSSTAPCSIFFKFPRAIIQRKSISWVLKSFIPLTRTLLLQYLRVNPT